VTLEIIRPHLELLIELSYEILLGNKTGFMQINLELRPPYLAFISPLHSYMMVWENIGGSAQAFLRLAHFCYFS
jgi:hypothetical protein